MEKIVGALDMLEKAFEKEPTDFDLSADEL